MDNPRQGSFDGSRVFVEQKSRALHSFPCNERRVSRMTRLEQLRNEASPAGLMRRAQATARVAVEIFVEEQVVPEMRVARLLRVAFQCRAFAILVLQEQTFKPPPEFVGNFVQRHEFL